MNNYAIYCTEEQTKKALELGAPINLGYHNDDFENSIKIRNLCYAEVPTTEHLIGWLEEEQYLYITIRYTNDVAKHWQADVDNACCIDAKCGENLVDFNFGSRKEATLAAIDAALDYLNEK